MSFKAEVLLDSVSPAGRRLTTMVCTYPRFVHAELLTHRMFSRNAASSRAIPVRKMLEEVTVNPVVPQFTSEQSGMQGGNALPDNLVEASREAWLQSARVACLYAEEMINYGVHKSVVNRILEPYSWITTIISATEWDDFWTQRCSPLAQPEIQAISELMREAYDNSTPTLLDYGSWHTPLIQQDEDDSFWFDVLLTNTPIDIHAWPRESPDEMRKRVSAARCARVSYLTHDGKRDIKKDLELYDRLVTADPPHWSPLEHVATPYSDRAPGNFRGWRQLRHHND